MNQDEQNTTEKHNGNVTRNRPLAESVLRLIWSERQISRADVARRLGLSRSTVSEILVPLLKTGLVAEVGIGKSRGGRPPIVLEFQDNARYIIGVDIGATHVSVVITNMRGKVLVWKEKNHPVRTDPEGTRELVFELCDKCIATQDKGVKRLFRIGVALPSPIDPIRPNWLSEVVIPAWQGRTGLERLQQKYNVPAHVDNDANLAALAEYWWGAGRGVDDRIFIKMGYGIGAGYIFGGNIYRGSSGLAGEIGHIPIDINGKQCVCGLKGCLTTFVGAEALVARARELRNKYPKSLLAGNSLTMTDIENAALSNDPLALQVVSELSTYMGIAIASLVNTMNPAMVILGGGMARLGTLLTEQIRDKVKRSTLLNPGSNVEIGTSKIGPQAVAIGAATLALDEALSEPNLFQRSARKRVKRSTSKSK
ncbi:MAG: ROK family transcriptional regulator [Ignavibacteriae bacterium]|nr:ROK family transcriptional regulator [Ignavibacteriota bacterium]